MKNERKVWDFLFEDEETGEEFFVECETIIEAREIAEQNFERPRYCGKYTPEEAEWWGLDTY